MGPNNGRLNLLSKVSSMTHRPYAGKTCTLRIKLAPDGMLLDIKPEGGDPALCQAALAAAKLAKIRNHQAGQHEVFKTRHWTSNRNRDVDCSDGQHQAPVATGFW